MLRTLNDYLEIDYMRPKADLNSQWLCDSAAAHEWALTDNIHVAISYVVTPEEASNSSLIARKWAIHQDLCYTLSYSCVRRECGPGHVRLILSQDGHAMLSWLLAQPEAGRASLNRPRG